MIRSNLVNEREIKWHQSSLHHFALSADLL